MWYITWITGDVTRYLSRKALQVKPSQSHKYSEDVGSEMQTVIEINRENMLKTWATCRIGGKLRGVVVSTPSCVAVVV